MAEIRERKEIDPKDTWDLSTLFASDEDWEKALRSIEEEYPKLAEYQGKLKDARTIREYYDLSMKVSLDLDDLFNYSSLRRSEDLRAADAQSMYARAYRLYVAVSTLTSFAEPEILSLSEEELQALAESEELRPYRVTLKRMLEKKSHTLSEKEEALLASFGEVTAAPGEIADNLLDADLTFEDAADSEGKLHPVSNASYISLQSSTDRELRKNAFKSLYKGYASHNNTLAATFAGNVKAAAVEANARHYASSRQMSLANAEIPESVYDNLIDTVSAHMPDMYRYERLRKRLLGIEDLHYYDLYAPLTSGDPKKYSFEEAKQLVLETLEIFGEEYLNTVKRAFDEHWIDIYPNKGKSGGAYSSGTYRSAPYILLNYNDSLENVSTLIHEMGHSLHTWHSNTHQPPQDANYTLFVAEVASTVNENLLIERLLSRTEDPKERLALLNQYLESFKGTIYRQTMFAEFEKEAHARFQQGEALSATMLNELYLSLIRKYFGEELVIDEEVQYEWSRIPHFYSPFYVYVYATGYSTAVALSEGILQEGESAVKRYREFLSMGSSLDPLSELRHAGVDLTTPAPIDTALKKFASVLDEAEKLADLLENA